MNSLLTTDTICIIGMDKTFIQLGFVHLKTFIQLDFVHLPVWLLSLFASSASLAMRTVVCSSGIVLRRDSIRSRLGKTQFLVGGDDNASCWFI